MTVRSLPARVSPLSHAHVKVPEGVDKARVSDAREDFGLPSQRTIWEREHLVGRRAKTVAVSRRDQRRTIRLTDRLDPFHEMDWNAQFTGSDWRRIEVQRHRLTTDARGNVFVQTTSSFAPIDMPPNESYTENIVRTMALLFQFGCLSTSQLCSWLNLTGKGMAYTLNRLYALGLIERMTPSWVTTTPSSRPGHGTGDIVRVNLRSDTVGQWVDGLSALEHALLTGGRTTDDLLRNGTFAYEQTLRHNLALAEVCLRALEVSPGVAGVWGEPLVQGDRFLGQLARGSVDVRTVRGDGAIVTKDGGVIVLELTGVQDATRSEHGQTLAARAAAWAAIAHLSQVPMSLCVVSIGGYSASRRIARHLKANVERELAAYFAHLDDREEAMKAIHMVSMQSWWPSPGAVSRKFVTLEAYSPLSEQYRELAPAAAQWDTRQPVVVNTVAALHHPAWALQPVAPLVAEGSAT